jgi:S-adenosylmethionine synthetase
MKKYITVESVTDGHPDKVCDQISDAILDAYLEGDPMSRVAVETFGSHGLLVIGGEVTSSARIDAEKIARQLYKDIGYKDDLKIITHITTQSPDIAQGVDTGGAGDQGIMYGFATDETEELLPTPVVYAHKITKALRDSRRNNTEFAFLGPDGKSQVTFEGGVLKTVLVSTQHDSKIKQEELKEKLTKLIFESALPEHSADDVQVLINPTGKFEIGGFEADAGLTGRKIIVDTYGGLVPHGGGAFSGKDPTKVDRSAAYYARYVAKNVVAKKLAKRCLVSVSYAIGHEEPLMVHAETERGDDEKVRQYVLKNFDFRPKAMIEELNLRRPIYKSTAAFGHFGREEFPWEKIT